ncbi:oxidoreductase [Mycobacterium sp. ACS1612]|uniref:SDR family NAD(P)-dependent oxidoreductase n=1 Tax=Mycobacterium sp. ACS1612 TaxID=1834117 RepID=UPI0008009F01|nr:SDR family NAD(P)-dependent oxidoreductase [Mycobacterium sp. ACS1612]OBF26752.1 oxidoreductase [Mycobacterium sp. ACS1612]
MANPKGLALVTGASSGIGFELAKLFADDGYDLVIAADDGALDASADKLAGSGVQVRPFQVDLRQAEEVERLYRSATEDGTRLAAAALNAGVGRAGPFVGGDLDDDLSIVDLNVRSTVHLAKLVLTDMAETGTGKVLFTSSISSTMPGSLQTIYNASKSFVQSFAEALHDELRDTGVTVTSLMPGPTATDFFRRAGMLDTVIGRMPKDDPAAVARQGYDALMRGDRKVVASSLLSKSMGMVNRALPDSVKAVASRMISLPIGKSK